MRIVTRGVLIVGATVGIVLAVLADAETGGAATFRLAVLPLALAAVIGGLIETVVLGRAEWRRVPPTRRDYARTVALFLLGLVLASLALG
jgi:hypothetical protein